LKVLTQHSPGEDYNGYNKTFVSEASDHGEIQPRYACLHKANLDFICTPFNDAFSVTKIMQLGMKAW